MLPFENLSGDPSLDRWQVPFQHAFQSMAGARLTVPGKDVAVLAGASAFTQGLIERGPLPSGLRLTLELYDVATHKLLRRETVEDPDPFSAIAKLAKAIEPKSTGLGNRTPEALALWTDVLNATTPPQLVEGCRKLLEAEPGFSPAYVSCGAAPFSPAERKAIGERGYANRTTLKPEAQFAVGQALFQSGRYQESIGLMTPLAPAMPGAWNTLGYSHAVLGDIEAAKKAFAEYRKFGGDEPNAVDSLGEAHYIVGKYEDAEKYFLECADKFPQTPQGRMGKLKAASMRALSGNRGGAEELARAMIDGLKKAGQPSKPIEDLWRGIILEQDPAAMRKKIEDGGIIVPPQRSE